MQVKLSIFLKNFIFIFLFILQLTDSQAQSSSVKLADSLFANKNYFQAENYYTTYLAKSHKFNPVVYLKLAYISEALNNYPKAIYYLNLYYLKKPNKLVYDKMNQLAAENNFQGYENTDLNFIVLLIRQYYNYILLILLGFSVFIFSILVYKKQTKQVVPRGQIGILVLFLIIFLILVNFPYNYRAVIIKKEEAFLRDFPSSASPIVGTIMIGNRLNVISKDDIWNQVFYDNKIAYIRDSDTWEVK